MGIFNYESKFMQFMLLVADYMILNAVYLLCCIPIFTIGAAQAGLYAGIKTLLDKDDGTPCLRSFFKGFRTGFGTVTVVWTIFTVIIVGLVWCCFLVMGYEFAGFEPQLWMIYVAIAICVIYQSNIPLFHANFGCTKMQLIRNVFFTTLAHPIRSIGVAAFVWFPVFVFAAMFPLFLQLTPIWFVAYYSCAFLLNALIMAKPYHTLTENFVAAYESAHGEIVVEADDTAAEPQEKTEV